MSRETMRARVDTLVGLLAPDQGESLTDERRRLFAIASAIQADLHATMPADPTPAEGVVVPLEPTPEMVEAGWRAKGGSHEGRPVWKCTVDVQVALIYLAMLAARPAAPTQSAAQTGEVERLKAALEECVSVLALAEHGKCEDPDHQEVVTALGQSIGFGALMSAAQYGWRETLRAKGYPLGGEFIAGPCYATVITALKQARQALSQPEPSL